jgi:tetratricopeptide (TPR) repeat protein
MNSDALGALSRTLALDPNNMEALKLKADIEEQMGDEDKSQKTLQEMIDIEKTPYFLVRSLPEMVETRTYEARVKLADKSTDNKRKVELLQPAVDGFNQYLTFTVPSIVRFAHNADGPLPFGGEDLDSAKKKMAVAGSAAKSLADAYRALGDPVKAAAADAAVAGFAKPLDPAPADAATGDKGLDLPSAK